MRSTRVFLHDKSQTHIKMRIYLLTLWIFLLPSLVLAKPNSDSRPAAGYGASSTDPNAIDVDRHVNNDCLLEARKQARAARKKCVSIWRGENIYMRLRCPDKAKKLEAELIQECDLASSK